MKKKVYLFFVPALFISVIVNGAGPLQDSLDFPYRKMPAVYPGTKQLTLEGDLSVRMLDGAHKFIEDKISKTVAQRNKYWKRNTASAEQYNSSVAENRKKLRDILGIQENNESEKGFRILEDNSGATVTMMKLAGVNEPELIAETQKYRVYAVKWNVTSRINGEGLLLQPKSQPVGSIVAIPDADQQPEQLAGLLEGIAAESQFARHLAESGYEVLVPAIISRQLLFAGEDKQQTYREWLYRQSFHMGHHIIGYEVQKVISAIEWFKGNDKNRKVGVAGYGEGGLLAFYAAAVDTRIDAVLVSGYFGPRERVWDEPIYRNVWSLLKQFGDAEIASLIAPRAMVIEYSRAPMVVDELKRDKSNREVEGLPYTGYKGKIETPAFADVKAEFDRISTLTGNLKFSRELVSSKNQVVNFGSREAVSKFVSALGGGAVIGSNELAKLNRKLIYSDKRQLSLLKEIEDEVQELVRDSDQRRKHFFLYKVMPEFAERKWSTRPYHQFQSVDKFVNGAKEYKKYFKEEILGVFTDSLLPFNAQTRKIYDMERYSGYEVVMDVYNNLFATGILLIPKDLKKDEKRPVVVCQHGRNDIPHKVVAGNFTSYNDAAAKLANEGFVVYVPQNPYRGEDRYRWLARKANTIGSTFFSFIVAQHDQATRWLGTLPFVDKNRIAFYGLSYGGQTAMRVPAVLNAYCLSIAAGDFGDWTRKVTDARYEGSFMNTLEWEMPYFRMGNTFSYAEMSYLIFPRPFMVERGHHDLVQPTEWVSYEYGKVRYFYDNFGLGDKTEIEFFNGGHSMKGHGTFRFLHKHLRWP